MREEIAALHRQHDYEQHCADAIVDERREAGEHRERGDERFELADGDADAADDTEEPEADGRGSKARAALARQPRANRSHVTTFRKI